MCVFFDIKPLFREKKRFFLQLLFLPKYDFLWWKKKYT